MYAKPDGQRDVSYEYFCLALLFVVEACEIVNGTHTELGEFDETYTKLVMPKIKLKLSSFRTF